MNIEPQFYALIEEIKEAGKVAHDYFVTDSTQNDQKADGSVVTEVDTAIERRLRVWIETNFPNDAIIGEEEEGKEGTSGFVWHVDPIDGTENFIRKIPFCCISVARLALDDEHSFGVVYNPFTKQLFSIQGEDNSKQNKRAADQLDGKMRLGTGRGSESWKKEVDYNLCKAFGMKYGSGKALGSSALELAYVADNHIDAFLILGLHSWDYAAGLYLVKAAGGMISVYENGEWSVWEKSLRELCAEHGKIIFASHPDIHCEIRDFIGDPKKWADD